MSVQSISLPDSLTELELSPSAASLVDYGYDAIEAYLLKDDKVITNFVPCDFHLVGKTLSWIVSRHLTVGNHFCEWGSGVGLVTMLAAIEGMDAIGIEIESELVDLSEEIAASQNVSVDFYCGSFVPRSTEDHLEMGMEIEHVETSADDVYEEIGMEMADFDLFFAYPWPGERAYFEEVFDLFAARGALLLTYDGREGMRLVRKT